MGNTDLGQKRHTIKDTAKVTDKTASVILQAPDVLKTFVMAKGVSKLSQSSDVNAALHICQNLSHHMTI